MMVIARYSRVLFSPITNCYTVQYKTWKFGRWKTDTTYVYYPDGSTPRGDTIYARPQAYTKACERADHLIRSCVVYYGQN